MTSTGSRPRQGRPPKIARHDVIDAAVAIADADGLEAVTIRGVAARLGVAPMTLYGHVTGADELVDLVVGATIRMAVAKGPGRATDARTALVDFARGFRDLLLDHPAVLDAYRRRPVQDPTGLSVTENVLSTLLADGLDEEVAVAAYAAVYAFVIGFVSIETRPVGVDLASADGHQTLRRVGDRLPAMFDRRSFEWGLEALVDGAVAKTDGDSRAPVGSSGASTARKAGGAG